MERILARLPIINYRVWSISGQPSCNRRFSIRSYVSKNYPATLVKGYPITLIAYDPITNVTVVANEKITSGIEVIANNPDLKRMLSTGNEITFTIM